MEEIKNSKKRDEFMLQIASFIVNYRKVFLIFFCMAFIYCLISISKVKVNDDLTKYLPDKTETRVGLDIMDEEFKTFGSAKIMIQNIDYNTALLMVKEFKDVSGVSGVDFYDADDEDYDDKKVTDYFKDFSAVYTINFDDEEEVLEVKEAMAKIRDIVKDYDCSVYTTVDKDDTAELENDMKFILVLLIIIIIAVLIFTSQTYMEIIIFMLSFGMAIVLNLGTNYIFGEISFVTDAVGTVLQIALAIDYAIILFHRFMEERKHKEAKEALIIALGKAIPEIASSSLTTMAGMAALMTMQFEIGMDLGRVLLKSIILSMVSIFVFMPILIMLFEKNIMKTMHKNFVPKITFWGELIVRLRYIIIPVFFLLVGFGIYFSNKCPYIYDDLSIESKKKNEYVAAREEIEKYFDMTDTMAVVIPKGDYIKEAKLLKEIENYNGVDEVVGLSNIEVGDDDEYVLTDSLTPREMAEVCDVDIDAMRFIYTFYAWKNEQVGGFLNSIDSYKIPIINMIDFINDQKENGGLKLDKDTVEDIDDIYKKITDARKQLEGDGYSRLIFTWNKPLEGKDTFESIDKVRTIALKYYDKVYLVGNSTSDYDISKSFGNDNVKITILTALMVGIILLFTFQSVGLPFLLVLTIQGSIWFNFSIPYLTKEPMYFLSYLIVSSIQMGATIDYAIVITSRYLALRKEMSNRKEAIKETLNQSFSTIITSGSIMAIAGFVIGMMTSNATISSLGMTLGMGVLISIILVMAVLPALLYVFNWLIDITSFSKEIDKNMTVITKMEHNAEKEIKDEDI